MKKFTIKIFIFIIYSCLVYVLLLFFYTEYTNPTLNPNVNYLRGSFGHFNTRIKEVKTQKNLDILFLGSSRAYRGFDTRIFSKHGYKTFNLGSSAQTPNQTKILLNRYLENLNPKMIIYEVYPSTFQFEGIESALDLISNDQNDLYSLIMVLKMNNIKVYNTFIYSLIKEIINYNKKYLEPINKNNDKYISGGYVQKKISYYQAYKLKTKKIELNKELFSDFLDIISMINNKNIKLILVYAPSPTSNYNRYINNPYFDSVMNSYSVFYNFNNILPLKDSFFYDYDHLNQIGVEAFNEKLIERIKKM